MRPNRTYGWRWCKYIGGCLSLLCATPALAASIPTPTVVGSEMQINGTLGIRCTSKNGTPPSFYMQGGSFDSDASVSMGLIIPFQSSTNSCNKILSYEESLARLLIAERLLERGIITPEEYKTIADEVHEVIKSR